jgi:hypothetical protein
MSRRELRGRSSVVAGFAGRRVEKGFVGKERFSG